MNTAAAASRTDIHVIHFIFKCGSRTLVESD